MTVVLPDSTTLGKPKTPIPAVDPYAPNPNLLAAAQAVAAGIVDPQVAAVNRAIEASKADAAANQQSAQGTMSALTNLNAGVPNAIRDAYQGSADRVAGYAAGLTGDLGDRARAAASAAAAHIASLGAPGTVTSMLPAQMNVEQYRGGVLPAAGLAGEAASRFAEATSLGAASTASIASQALQAANTSAKEIADLRAKGVDIENQRPVEVMKALTDLRAQDVQERQFQLQVDAAKAQTANDHAKLAQDKRALAVQTNQLNRAWYQTLSTEAFNRTNATGQLWTVTPQGKLVNTGQPAPGSKAALAAAANRVANRKITVDKKIAQDKADAAAARALVTDGFTRARIGISRKEAKIAAKREQAYEKTKKGLPGGMHQSEVLSAGKTAGSVTYAAFHGVPNKNYVPAADPNVNPHAPKPGDTGYDPKIVNKWITPPVAQPDAVVHTLNSMQIPYSIFMDAIVSYARQPNSPWHDEVLGPNGWFPHGYPPPQKKK